MTNRDTSPIDLELATDKELAEELMRRYDVGLMFLRKSQMEGIEHRTLMIFGDAYTCLGMADVLLDEIRMRIVAGDDLDDTGDE